MSKTNPTMLESFKLEEQLLEEIKQHKTINQQTEKKYRPPKWLMGNEIWYSPKKRRVKNG